MSEATITKPTKQQVADALKPAAPAATLEALRDDLAILHAELGYAQSEETRCLAESLKLSAAQDAAATARSALEQLHARRVAGEVVTNAQITTAEAALAAASSALGRAEAASSGARAAAAKFAAEAAIIGTKISTKRDEAKLLVAQVLRARAAKSMEEYRRALDEFLRGAHAKHHGEIFAIDTFAKQHGLGAMPFAAPHQGSFYLEFPCVPPAHLPMASTYSVDCRSMIDAEEKRVTDEIERLFP